MVHLFHPQNCRTERQLSQPHLLEALGDFGFREV